NGERRVRRPAHEASHGRLTGRNHAVEALEIGDPAQQVPVGSNHADQLAAVAREQNHVVPGRLRLLDAPRLGVKSAEVFQVERLRLCQRLKDADRRRHLALDGGGLHVRGLNEPPLGGGPLFADKPPHHDSGKNDDGQRRAGREQQEQGTEMEVTPRLSRGAPPFRRDSAAVRRRLRNGRSAYRTITRTAVRGDFDERPGPDSSPPPALSGSGLRLGALKAAEEEPGEDVSDLLRARGSFRLEPARNPVHGAEQDESQQLRIAGGKTATLDAVLDQAAHAALEPIAAGDDNLEVRRAQGLESEEQRRAVTLVENGVNERGG